MGKHISRPVKQRHIFEIAQKMDSLALTQCHGFLSKPINVRRVADHYHCNIRRQKFQGLQQGAKTFFLVVIAHKSYQPALCRQSQTAPGIKTVGADAGQRYARRNDREPCGACGVRLFEYCSEGR